MPDAARYDYLGRNAEGLKVSGQVSARNQGEAFSSLRSIGVTPSRLAVSRSIVDQSKSARSSLNDTRLQALLNELGILVEAGVDLKGALSLQAKTTADARLRALLGELETAISAGTRVSVAFVPHLKESQQFIASLLEAGELVGNLGSALKRSSDILAARVRLRTQLMSSLAYPGFIFGSSLVSLLVILVFVVPSLEPLAKEQDQGASPFLGFLIAISSELRGNALTIAALLAGFAGLVLVGWHGGLLRWLLDRALFRGPLKSVANDLVLGRLAHTLGNLVEGGAALADAVRISVTLVGSELMRQRLRNVVDDVRRGERLSAILGALPGAPPAIVRLCAVGEASGRLGELLSKAGETVEESALRRIDRYGKMLGPVLIVLLGLLIGGMMAGLMSSISGIGQQGL